MSDTVTCDACMLTQPSRTSGLQLVLPRDEDVSESRYSFGLVFPERWDACSAACARVLVDRFEAQVVRQQAQR